MITGFKHELGATAQSITRGFKGVIGARSECLYGCNRYLLEPTVNKEGKMGESYYFDEDDVKILKPRPKKKPAKKDTGGPASTKS